MGRLWEKIHTAKLSEKKGMIVSAAIVMAALMISTIVFAAGGGGMGSGGGGMGPGGGGNMGQVEMSESVISVKLQTPERGDLTRTTEFIGKIEPAESVNVYPEISGKVTNIYFDAGETVNKGDLLFEMDDTDAQLSYEMAQVSYEQKVISANTTLGSGYESKVLSAKSSLQTAQQNLSNARYNLREYNDGYDDRLLEAEEEEEEAFAKLQAALEELEEAEKNGEDTTELSKKVAELEVAHNLAQDLVNEYEDDDDATLRSYRTSYKNALASYNSALANYNLVMEGSLEDTQASVEAELKAADLSLEQSAATLEKYKVYAPISGVIETKSVTSYETATANTAAFTISNKDTMTVKFNASADAANALSIGDSITLSKGGNEYTATIIEIDTKADESTGLFPIKARVEENDGTLLTGVAVKVTAATQKAQDAMLIPIDLVYYEEGQPYVFTYSDGKAHRTDIETGMSNSETIVVTSGLTTDSQIITTWHPDLKDGATVKLAQGQDPQDAFIQEPAADQTEPDGEAIKEESVEEPMLDIDDATSVPQVQPSDNTSVSNELDQEG
ncbi:efflux RND transporter periplasmic adaptor subunit [Youxingia wuxianensis]|uniref:Efflux RND transporter periplasmic adaptor subunit n=1 Tax=Youxingia wuxianensis TaxID=2763678 RepID=A0A926EP55_9FIRM|nr:efflux RND transporter periplasmic adaptor subunit [Youxingia wuxianensis]MBC8583999.1 efflux RND transporter periplasmic adaptor subunit [Youxingia wuxianensis]